MRQRIYRWRERRAGYRNLNDAASLARAGRSTPRPSSAPCFYRSNGVPIDLSGIWSGRTAFLIANGPSFKTVDHSLLRRPGILTAGMNNGPRLFRPNIWINVDEPCRFMKDIWDDPTLLKFTPLANLKRPLWDSERSMLTDRHAGDSPFAFGFHRNLKFSAETFLTEDTINWGNHPERAGGRSVLLAALRILHILGFRRVYMLGLDFEMSGDNPYGFDETRTEEAVRRNNESYRALATLLESLKPVFDRDGFEVYNLNRDSKLTVFPFMSMEEAVNREQLDVSASTRGMYDRVITK